MRSDITPMTLRENKVTTLLAHCIHCSRLKLNSALIGGARFKFLANVKMNDTKQFRLHFTESYNKASKNFQK